MDALDHLLIESMVKVRTLLSCWVSVALVAAEASGAPRHDALEACQELCRIIAAYPAPRRRWLIERVALYLREQEQQLGLPVGDPWEYQFAIGVQVCEIRSATDEARP